MHNKVNIEFLQKQVEKLLDDVGTNREMRFEMGVKHY